MCRQTLQTQVHTRERECACAGKEGGDELLLKPPEEGGSSGVRDATERGLLRLGGCMRVNVSAPQILQAFTVFMLSCQNAYVDTWRNMTGQEIGISSAF